MLCVVGALTQWDKIYQLAQFGACTPKLMAATIDGDLHKGIQFVGQSQGLIHDIPTVQVIMDRCIDEAVSQHSAVGRYIVNSDASGTAK